MLRKHAEVTERIIGAYRVVYNTLGFGFAERVYHAAMVVELRRADLRVESEVALPVHYRSHLVGEFYADLVVNDCVIVELKAVKALLDEHRAQLFSYLKASRFEVGLLMNFGSAPEYERKAYDNEAKGSLTWLAPNAMPR